MTGPSEPTPPWPARVAAVLLEVIFAASVSGLAFAAWAGAGHLDPGSLTRFEAALLSAALFLAMWVVAGLLPPVWAAVLAATAAVVSMLVWSVADGGGFQP